MDGQPVVVRESAAASTMLRVCRVVYGRCSVIRRGFAVRQVCTTKVHMNVGHAVAWAPLAAVPYVHHMLLVGRCSLHCGACGLRCVASALRRGKKPSAVKTVVLLAGRAFKMEERAHEFHMLFFVAVVRTMSS